ncbi:MAG: UDP-2,3-diacylglucosamine diphosphatase [Desulfuromonadales bacterium]|nr:UDP-2,3-diacylglucosamine diphosphatase [Desulfuromonadales bacterium]
MRAIFLSDAHLRNPQDRNYQLLIDFLKQQKDLDALFLLGDIFEFWLGYKHLIFSVYIPILETLRRLTDAGTKLYFVEGNHDFNMGPYFTETLQCTLVPDQQIIDWDGHNILICHGDLLNPSAGYRRLRAFWRSAPVKLLSRIIHPDLVWAFALWLSNKSSKNDPHKLHSDPTPYLRNLIEKEDFSNCQIVVCGHYHYPTENEHHNTKIIALGDWISQFSYAEMVDGRITLKTYAG